MIPRNTKILLLYLLKHVNSVGYNINKLAKTTEISVGSAFKILKELEQNKIVVKQEISNASHYKLNFQNTETIKLCELLLLTEKRELKGHAKIYADELVNFEDAELILLFGSVLKGKTFNDVDVLFISEKTKKVKDFCLEISTIRTKPVVPLIMKKEDFVHSINKDAIISLLEEGVVLKGETTYVEVVKSVNSQR